MKISLKTATTVLAVVGLLVAGAALLLIGGMPASAQAPAGVVAAAGTAAGDGGAGADSGLVCEWPMRPISSRAEMVNAIAVELRVIMGRLHIRSPGRIRRAAS